MSLPLLYAKWMREALTRPVPDEKLSTCLDCAMCPSNSIGRPQQVATFNPSTKCCTYLPALRNFHIGRVLGDPDPLMAFGRETLQQRIDAGIGVIPLGLAWPAAFETRYDEDLQRDFGRRHDMLCPHYIDRDGGLCGIWKHRNGVCSTWFCRYEHGEKGQVYWEAMYRMLELAEEMLAWHCVRTLDIGDQAFEVLEQTDEPRGNLDGSVPITDAMRQAVWGRWYRRELEFYEKSAELVNQMSWADVLAVGGRRLASKVEEIEEAHEDMLNRRLPPFVEGGSTAVLHEEDGQVWVRSYRSYDSVPISRAAFDVIEDLNVIMMDDLRERLEPHLDAHLQDDTLRYWVELGLLKPTLPPFQGDDGP